MPANTIAENLVRLRNINNLTQKELSHITGINKSHISKYERGKLFPTKKNSIILSNFFNLNTKYFYDDYLEKMDSFHEDLTQLLNNTEFSKNKICKILNISKRSLYRFYYGYDIPSRDIFSRINNKIKLLNILI